MQPEFPQERNNAREVQEGLFPGLDFDEARLPPRSNAVTRRGPPGLRGRAAARARIPGGPHRASRGSRSTGRSSAVPAPAVDDAVRTADRPAPAAPPADGTEPYRPPAVPPEAGRLRRGGEGPRPPPRRPRPQAHRGRGPPARRRGAAGPRPLRRVRGRGPPPLPRPGDRPVQEPRPGRPWARSSARSSPRRVRECQTHRLQRLLHLAHGRRGDVRGP